MDELFFQTDKKMYEHSDTNSGAIGYRRCYFTNGGDLVWGRG
jgi:hypothetical protein